MNGISLKGTTERDKKNMNRRTFLEVTGLVAAGAISEFQPAIAATPDKNAGTRKPTRVLDSEEYTRLRIQTVKPSMTFKAQSPAQARDWQKRTRKKLIEQLMGQFPEKIDLAPETVERREFDRYTREKILFQSRDNLTVKAYFLLPKSFRAPGRCMICLPGHGRGVDDIVGIEENGAMRSAYSGYQKDFALQCTDRGIAALAIEQLAFGERRDERARKAGAEKSSCDQATTVAFMLGETMIGWRVWDVIRAIDYLETRKEIDPRRIGAMGISGGGTATFWSACVEPRIKVAYVSGYFCRFDHCILAVPHCVDNYIPGIYRLGDMPEFSGLIAPRPLFAESGTKDNIFLIDGVKAAVARAREIYKVFKADDRIDAEFFEGEHQFHGIGGFQFVEKRL